MKMLIVLIVFNLSILYRCEGSLTTAQQKELLNIHNNLRRQVALGKLKGHPAAADMLEMKWSSESAAIAQRTADQCKFNHDSYANRKYGSFKFVGQNIASFSSSNISSGVQMWFDEFKDFNLNDNSCRSVCGHYTQVVWAKSNELGCGMSKCTQDDWDMTYLFCNYATAGNFNSEKPYQSGSACSKCPAKTKCSNGLCR